MLDINPTHFHRNILNCQGGTTKSDSRELKGGYMIWKKSFVDSKIRKIIADFIVKIEQLKFSRLI